MKIQTKHLGEVEIQKQDIITFQSGLPGFEEYKEYVLLAIDPDLPIASLQCITEQNIGFIVGLPYAFKQDYAFELSEEDIEELAIQKPEDVLTYAIVTLKETFSESTLNLLAPLVINTVEKVGKQIVLSDSKSYSLRYPLNIEAIGATK